MEMDIRQNAWTPGGDVADHCRGPIRYDADFFAAPPPEIGRVLTADSALQRDDPPLSNAAFRKSVRKKLAIVFLLSLAAVVVICVTSLYPDRPFKPIYVLGYSTMVIAICVPVFPYIIIKQHYKRKSKVITCSFVGENGAAIYTLNGGVADGAVVDTLVFSQAADLLVDRTAGHKYNWRNAEGESLMVSKRTCLDPLQYTAEHPFYFFQAAEEQWCDYLYEKAKAEFEADGSVRFAIGSRRAIRIGLGYVEFVWPGGTHRAPAEELANMSLSHSVFSFSHSDSAWMGKDGEYNFKYAEMSNAKLFVTLLDHLAGISISDANRHLLPGASDVIFPSI